MKSAKFVTFLWSSLLSFSLSLSAAMWLVTAFDLGVDTGFLTVFCFIASLVCSLCYTLPLGAAPLGVGVLSLGIMWRSGDLEAGVEAILNRLSRQYNNAYNWGIIRWSHRTADDMEPLIVTALCILAAITILATAWAVCRKKSSFFPVLSILYVAACFVVNDTVPSVGWIFLLLLTVILLLMTGRVRRQSEPAANRLLLLLIPCIALGLFLVFLTNPRSTYDKQEIARYTMDKILGSDHMQYLMGEISNNDSYDKNVNLTVVGYRTAPESVVMQVSAPFTDTLYLRSSAMDTYDGKSWSQSGGPDLPWPENFLVPAGEVTVVTRFAHQMLYVPYYSRFSGLSDVSKGVPNQMNLREYSFAYQQLPATMTPQSAALLSSSAPYQVKLDDYLHITPEVKTWAEPLAVEITQGAGSFAEKAERIASFVRNSARYDLKTARMPAKENDFAKWFLEESETGYCVHFATSTAVLLQALGIPARYVTGYLTSVTAGQVTEVKSKQSHAWVEYWLPGFGWTVLESTPPAALPEIPEPTETQEIPDGETNPTTAPETETTVPEATTSTEETKPQAQLLPGQKDHTILLTAILWVAVAAALIAAAFIQRSIRLRRWQKRLADAAPNQRALLLWQNAEHLASLLNTQPPKELLELAEKAKFSHHTLTPEELQPFGLYRREAVEALKKRNLFLQIYYRLILAKY